LVKVKICGITNLEDARGACFLGADALGFVFYKKSSRYVSPLKAYEIIKALPRGVKKVGVFVDATIGTIKRIDSLLRLDFIQLHGNESPAFCRKLKLKRIIKAFRIKDKFNPKELNRYRGVYAFLFDAFDERLKGGGGKRFDWSLIKDIRCRKRFVLSGGLNHRNVREAILALHPDWVDVSSGVEISPGKKDRILVKKFIKKAKEVK